jgi:3-oxoacyl-[acyl-carrier protein] reductase
MLKNKIALVTGASKGIGKSIAEMFAENEARLVLTGRDEALLQSVASTLKPHPEGHLVFGMDVKNTDSIKSVFDQLVQGKIYIDALVNNAGIMRDATLQMVKSDMIYDVFETNVYGTIYPTQLALKSFLRKRGGSIINLTSIIGVKGNAGQSIYSSSKSAIIGFTKSLSKELAPLNIRVNAISPGFIDTDLTIKTDARVKEKALSFIGMRRIGKPEDVAKVALFLASDLSAYVTGQVIGVDGGMII